VSAPRWREPRPNRALIGAVTWLNRAIALPRLARVAQLDLPAADLVRLRDVVRPGAAAFLAPNHPEFLTDLVLDKEISARVSPIMAFWMAHAIVDASPLGRALWLRHDVISNRPDGDGRAASVRWALSGRGVLLHPEGTASWHGGHVGPLMPGVAELAALTVASAPGVPTWVVPIVWRLRFRGDASAGLGREMGVIERALDLGSGDGLPPGERFAVLAGRLLERRRAVLDLPGAGTSVAGAGYFAAQAATVAALRERLGLDPAAAPAGLARLMRRAQRARDARERERWLELWRLEGFAPAIYDRPALEPERIAESLKRVRSALVRDGWRNALHNVVPRPVADRLAHVRVPGPIAAHEFLAGEPGAAARERLLAALAERLRQGLDALAAELEPLMAPHRLPNPLWSGAAER
jgi:hypothetical protein